MSFSRRTLLSLPAALPLVNLVVPSPSGDDGYFPPPDTKGGWRTLSTPSEIRTRAGIDKARLDSAFEYTKTTSQHGGLLVVRRGHLIYERYFGRGDRDANPNMYSIGKMFTSACCGIMLSEHKDRFPDGLDTKVFTQEFLPSAFPLSYSKQADIRLGHLLTMTSGIQNAHGGTIPPGGHQTAIVHGQNVNLPYYVSTDPAADQLHSQDGSAMHGKMWAAPGQGYLYSRDPHVASIVLRGVVGMELQAYIGQRLADPMGWGRWGYATHTAEGVMPHTPGEGGIALHSTDALRFAYMLLHEGRWKNRQLIPRDYIGLIQKPSPYNPHSPFSLQFEVNTDGHVAGAPRDTFFKSGAGGFGLYVIPSMDMVVYKMSSLNESTYDPSATGLPLTYSPDTSRDDWKPHPFNQFVDGPIEGDTGVRRTLEMVVAAVV
ncbi:serine hydrolase domain-containing protein [Silvibacterium acidisoli]|uniref:serine hydrolase domain-containing protein n=1 Tax=Acidobacteriaceae bacterium ZG23-2 TaxID=2883246 RepID=UPI00406D3725